MKLIYRGITYEHNPFQKKTRRPFQSNRKSSVPYNLNYRGITYHIAPDAKHSEVPVKPAAYELIYRGVTYWVNRNEQGEVTATTSSTSLSNHRTSMNARPAI